MMERRDFVGAMLALFAGVAIPEPVLEAVRLITPAKGLWSTDLITSGATIDTAKIDAALKEIYMRPIIDGTFNQMQLYMNEVFGTALDGVKCYGKTHYFEVQRS